MTPAYLHLMQTSPVLAYRSTDPEILVRGLGLASSGEEKMIRAALSLIPAWWLDRRGIHVEPFRLEEVEWLDEHNTRALLEAVSIAAGYPLKLQ